MRSSALTQKRIFSIKVKRTLIVEIISSLFVLLFVYTAVSKLSDYQGFVSTLSRSPLVGNKAATIGWAIPLVELIVSVLLFVPKTKRIGLLASLGLMIFFTAYLFYMIYFTKDLPCSCGGVLNRLSWKQHLIFNGVFTLIGLAGVILTGKRFTQDNNPTEGRQSVSYS